MLLEDMEKLETLCIAGRYVKWCSHFREHFSSFQKVKYVTVIWPRNSTPTSWDIVLSEME